MLQQRIPRLRVRFPFVLQLSQLIERESFNQIDQLRGGLKTDRHALILIYPEVPFCTR